MTITYPSILRRLSILTPLTALAFTCIAPTIAHADDLALAPVERSIAIQPTSPPTSIPEPKTALFIGLAFLILFRRRQHA